MNEQIFFFINGLAGQNQLLDTVMIFCASSLVFGVFALAIVCVAYRAYRGEWIDTLYFFGVLVATFTILQLFSLTSLDNRPFVDHNVTQLIAHAADKTFPSDHTTVTAGIAFALLLARFKKLGLLVLAVAVLIGLSRVYVGVHYPLDIIGGLVTAVLGGAVVYGVKRFVTARQPKG